ncbi:SDR family oxidoreductase [Shewanella fidelis]|uniref:SDR family oxidoreductase n=1 Tax=Shewanella fidelis TaxID=173509 RepID=A0AAW8NTJ3_9GAMM|nr:SDR family oxidoreductase [Shewanella fidelis]MDR8525249.1 SDR family oxidoreductase [Shewanella fidelis]MDW4811320.1 SDR family oxidoreductase [Shewanella fidelis]MDW4814901.1 SDR family oxidoreductase [Shewanella fidelis]MDW4818991.1 SDR family oxidoreductase [Shewanella fidelis]MDW4823332.1 SDR family oxidoreductase [Shewanella fidelis]
MKQLIVITGASSGIGAAMAKAFSAKGHPLLLLARRIEPMQALGLDNCLAVSVDVTDADAMKAAIASAEAKFGPVGCLINNAGVMLLGSADTQDPAEWSRMLNINVMGVLNGIHAVLADMKARKTGTIINVSSIAGRKTFPNHAAYCATKFAVHALTENIREEVAMDDVRMITIAPGAVETELLSHTTSEEIKAGYQDWKQHMGGVIAPETIAEAALFAFEQPQSVCVREIVLAATRQEP